MLCTCQSESWEGRTWAPTDYNKSTSDHTGDSDNSSSFQYQSDIILTLEIVEI